MLTISGIGQFTKGGAVAPAPTDLISRFAEMAAKVSPVAAVPVPTGPSCPYGYVANQGMCVTQGCVDGMSPCIVLDGNGQTCSYDSYLAYWHQSGVQACGPTPAPQFRCSDGSFVDDPSKCPVPQFRCSDGSFVDDPSKCPVSVVAAQYVCADNSVVDDPAKCPAATPAEGSSSGMQVTPTSQDKFGPVCPSPDPRCAIEPYSPTPAAMITPELIISPSMAFGLGVLGALASAFVAYKTTGVTRLLASVGALGIGALTAYRAVQGGVSAPVAGLGYGVFHPYGESPRTIRLLG